MVCDYRLPPVKPALAAMGVLKGFGFFNLICAADRTMGVRLSATCRRAGDLVLEARAP